MIKIVKGVIILTSFALVAVMLISPETFNNFFNNIEDNHPYPFDVSPGWLGAIIAMGLVAWLFPSDDEG